MYYLSMAEVEAKHACINAVEELIHYNVSLEKCLAALETLGQTNENLMLLAREHKSDFAAFREYLLFHSTPFNNDWVCSKLFEYQCTDSYTLENSWSAEASWEPLRLRPRSKSVCFKRY